MTSLTRRRTLGALTGLALGSHALPFAAYAQDFPSRPMKLFAPIAPGGLTDTLARALATRVGERIGQPMVVENRPGGGGVIGMQAAARSPADGYSLILVYQGVASVNPVLLKNPPYDTMRDFVPVALVARFPTVLVVNPGLGVDSLRGFLDLVRANPGKYNYGSAGNATTSHLTMELFKRAAGVDIVHVPYKGEAPALAEVVGGTVSALFATPTVSMPMVQAGRVRALGLSTRERSPLVPGMATIAESGLPQFEVSGWYGVLAPAGTPAPIVERLNREFRAVLAEPELRARLAAQGVEPTGSTPQEAARWIRDDTEKWRRVITEAKISVD